MQDSCAVAAAGLHVIEGPPCRSIDTTHTNQDIGLTIALLAVFSTPLLTCNALRTGSVLVLVLLLTCNALCTGAAPLY